MGGAAYSNFTMEPERQNLGVPKGGTLDLFFPYPTYKPHRDKAIEQGKLIGCNSPIEPASPIEPDSPNGFICRITDDFDVTISKKPYKRITVNPFLDPKKPPPTAPYQVNLYTKQGGSPTKASVSSKGLQISWTRVNQPTIYTGALVITPPVKGKHVTFIIKTYITTGNILYIGSQVSVSMVPTTRV